MQTLTRAKETFPPCSHANVQVITHCKSSHPPSLATNVSHSPAQSSFCSQGPVNSVWQQMMMSSGRWRDDFVAYLLLFKVRPLALNQECLVVL